MLMKFSDLRLSTEIEPYNMTGKVVLSITWMGRSDPGKSSLHKNCDNFDDTILYHILKIKLKK